MRIRTTLAAVALAAATVLGGAGAAAAADPDPHDGHHVSNDVGINVLCGLGLLGVGACGNS